MRGVLLDQIVAHVHPRAREEREVRLTRVAPGAPRSRGRGTQRGQTRNTSTASDHAATDRANSSPVTFQDIWIQPASSRESASFRWGGGVVETSSVSTARPIPATMPARTQVGLGQADRRSDDVSCPSGQEPTQGRGSNEPGPFGGSHSDGPLIPWPDGHHASQGMRDLVLRMCAEKLPVANVDGGRRE